MINEKRSFEWKTIKQPHGMWLSQNLSSFCLTPLQIAVFTSPVDWSITGHLPEKVVDWGNVKKNNYSFLVWKMIRETCLLSRYGLIMQLNYCVRHSKLQIPNYDCINFYRKRERSSLVVFYIKIATNVSR